MNIGDYVRTKKGISKIIKIENEQTRKIIYTDTKDVFEYYTDYQGNEIKDYWINYSTNLKNVIEAGDVIRFIYDGVKYICNVEEELTVNLEDDMIYIKKLLINLS